MNPSKQHNPWLTPSHRRRIREIYRVFQEVSALRANLLARAMRHGELRYSMATDRSICHGSYRLPDRRASLILEPTGRGKSYRTNKPCIWSDSSAVISRKTRDPIRVTRIYYHCIIKYIKLWEILGMKKKKRRGIIKRTRRGMFFKKFCTDTHRKFWFWFCRLTF